MEAVRLFVSLFVFFVVFDGTAAIPNNYDYHDYYDETAETSTIEIIYDNCKSAIYERRSDFGWIVFRQSAPRKCTIQLEPEAVTSPDNLVFMLRVMKMHKSALEVTIDDVISVPIARTTVYGAFPPCYVIASNVTSAACQQMWARRHGCEVIVMETGDDVTKVRVEVSSGSRDVVHAFVRYEFLPCSAAPTDGCNLEEHATAVEQNAQLQDEKRAYVIAIAVMTSCFVILVVCFMYKSCRHTGTDGGSTLSTSSLQYHPQHLYQLPMSINSPKLPPSRRPPPALLPRDGGPQMDGYEDVEPSAPPNGGGYVNKDYVMPETMPVHYSLATYGVTEEEPTYCELGD